MLLIQGDPGLQGSKGDAGPKGEPVGIFKTQIISTKTSAVIVIVVIHF